MIAADFKVWDGVYASFDEAPAIGPGFAGPIWHQRSMQSAREEAAKLAAGEPLEYSLRQRNAILPVVAAMLLGRQSGVNILDFGGGPGTAFMVLMNALGDDIKRVDYQIVEVDGLCRAARELFAAGPGPTFQPELPAAGPFDIVQASSVMQYIGDWRSVVRRLAGYGAPYLLFGDVFIGEFSTYVTLQNYYDSRIPHWFINAGEFIGEVGRQGYELMLRAACDGRILGVYGALPMDNFPPALRIPHTTHLLFSRSIGRS
jgi:putative methyltransferase (TIGR04325 family)